jgi:hypothetical protein
MRSRGSDRPGESNYHGWVLLDGDTITRMLQRSHKLRFTMFSCPVKVSLYPGIETSRGGGLDGARGVRIISGSGGYLLHRVYANYPRRYC